MVILEVATQEEKEVLITAVIEGDFRNITRRRFFFDWKLVKDSCRLYKLMLKETGEVLGLMALADHADEMRVEIKLLAVSAENKGEGKIFDGIAGCLIGYACQDALERYDIYANVSLMPKTVLKAHYMSQYGMLDAGRQVYLEKTALENVIEKYCKP